MPPLNRRIGALLLSLAIVAGMAWSGLSPVVGQRSDVRLAPRVIASSPAQREVVGPDATIQITFDQPMNRAGVEALFRLEPRVAGTFAWADDFTVTFDPTGPLTRGQEYSLILDAQAISLGGVAMESEYRLTFTVTPNLSVSQVIPTPDAENIEAGATITVVFDRPVVPLVTTGEQKGLPQPLTFDPPVEGKGEWAGTAIYIFRPTKAMAGGTKYTVTVSGDLKDVDGTPIQGAYTWSFRTNPPQLLSYDPAQSSTMVPLDNPIALTFNQPMDRSTTEAAFTLRNTRSGANVAGAFLWDEEDRVLRFKPTSRLELETAYQVAILGKARSASGQATLTNPISYVFFTVPYPKVVETNPQNNGIGSPGRGAYIRFNTYMDEKSFAGKVHVDPQPERLSVNGYGSNLSIDFISLPETTYTITLDAGITDIYGNPLKEAYTFKFTVAPFSPTIGLARRDQIAITSAYRPQTALKVAGINISKIDAKLAVLEPFELLSRVSNGEYIDLYRYSPPRINREWFVPIDAGRNKRADVDLTLKDGGGALPPGIYYVEFNAPEVVAFQIVNRQEVAPIRQIVVVSTLSMVSKLAPDGATLVWVTDLKTGQPVPNIKVSAYVGASDPLGSGVTGPDGMARLNVPRNPTRYDRNAFYLIATGENAFGLTNTSWIPGGQGDDVYYDLQPQKAQVYLYTDQPIYRPGRPVYFRGLVRMQDDVTFTVPAVSDLELQITNATGQEILRKPILLNSYGGFSDKIDLPQDAPLGAYYLRIYQTRTADSSLIINGGISFQVAEFRPPEFLVSATPDKPEVAAGDKIRVAIDAKFLFGGPVSGGVINWTAIANTGYFSFAGAGNYDLQSDYRYVYNRTVATGAGKLDEKGQFVIEFSADLGGMNVTQNFTIEASVTDISNQVIAGRASVMVHPASLYLGLQPDKYVGKAGEAVNVKVIAVDWASQPVPGQTLTIRAVERRWEQDPKTLEWALKEIPVTESRLTTDDKGLAAFSFTPPNAGIYDIIAETRDPRERIASSKTTLWVQGPTSVSWGGDDKSIKLVLDKKGQYRPGETASILIASPFPEPVKALITVERAGIMKVETVEITGSYTYQLPIEVVHAPNVYVSVALARGSGKGTDDGSIVPEVRLGTINVDVEVQQQLKITLTPSTKQAQPGATVKFDVLVTDLQNRPISAEVGLSLSDVATLSVGSPNSGPIFATFWGKRGLSIYTASALTRIIDDLLAKDVALDLNRREQMAFAAMPTMTAGAADGVLAPAPGRAESKVADEASGENERGAAQNAAPTPRTNFVDTPLWKADLVTDAAGKGEVTVTLPDNLTTWRLDARGISLETFVGQAQIEIVSTKPLLVRPATPRFFVVGDETELAMVVNNNTDRDLAVDVALDAKGVTLRAEAKQQVNIPKAGRVRVTWLATVEKVENVDLVFSAISGEFSDASKPAVGIGDARLLPVYNYEAPDYVATAGVLRDPGQRAEGIKLPSLALAPSGELTVKLQPSLAATTLDGLTYLRNYPYQCVEQTVSRFLPNIITLRALQRLNVSKPELKAQLDQAVAYALARLVREQKPDGGWGWYPADESNPLTTAYALWALVEARDADYRIEPDVINRALAFLQGQPRTVTIETPFWELNRTSFLLFVLARAGSPNIDQMEALFKIREKTNLYARALLAQAYDLSRNAAGLQERIDTLVSDFQSAAVVSATGIHWEEKNRDWWNWDSDTRTTAMILQTLVKFQPRSDLIPNVVRWLMVARKGDAWETTQETAWAVMALTTWMEATGELKANYTYDVSLNDKNVGSGTANAETLRDTKTLQISVADMLRDQINRLVIEHKEGPGSLYYTATLRVNQPVEAIKPTNRGFAFNRTYWVNGKPVTSAKVGDVITVVLEVTVTQNSYYVVINDPIPAGTEAIDRSLQTTTQVGQRPELTNEAYDYFGRGWGWWWFSHTALETEKVVLTAQYLPRGNYRYVYQIQATTPGAYRVIPANGNQFYFPEVFGRGAGALFTVVGEE